MISGQLDTQQRTHLEVGGDVGELEVLGEVKLRQVAHVGEVEHVPVLRAALGAAVQRRHVLARGSYTDQSLKRRLNEGSRRFHNHGKGGMAGWLVVGIVSYSRLSLMILISCLLTVGSCSFSIVS